jgi:hypothetical protein
MASEFLRRNSQNKTKQKPHFISMKKDSLVIIIWDIVNFFCKFYFLEQYYIYTELQI